MTTTQTMPNTFEEGVNELETLVKTLESGQMPLESAIAVFKRGMYLRRFCEEKLKSAKLEIDQVTLDDQNQPILKRVDETETFS